MNATLSVVAPAAAILFVHAAMAFSDAVPKERILVEQKEALVRRLLTDSPAVARIWRSL